VRSVLLLFCLFYLVLAGCASNASAETTHSAGAEERYTISTGTTPPSPPQAEAPQAAPLPPLPPEPVQRQAQPQQQKKQPVYFEPTYLNLLRAMIRFKGFDINNDNLLDAYTLIEGCDLYTKFYKDDFAWKQIRTLYRKSLAQKMELLPEYFSFATPLVLDRYDFEVGIFRFAPSSVMRNTHRLVLSDHPVSTCASNSQNFRRLPTEIGVDVLPFTIEGLKIPADQAESLISDMKLEKNKERVVYARFHVYIFSAPLLPISDDIAKTSHYVFQGNLETISFFEDPDLRHLLWVYRPVYQDEEQKAREMNDILNLKRPQVEQHIQPAPAPINGGPPPN
jgi:hypothetical protein